MLVWTAVWYGYCLKRFSVLWTEIKMGAVCSIVKFSERNQTRQTNQFSIWLIYLFGISYFICGSGWYWYTGNFQSIHPIGFPANKTEQYTKAAWYLPYPAPSRILFFDIFAFACSIYLDGSSHFCLICHIGCEIWREKCITNLYSEL